MSEQTPNVPDTVSATVELVANGRPFVCLVRDGEDYRLLLSGVDVPRARLMCVAAANRLARWERGHREAGESAAEGARSNEA